LGSSSGVNKSAYDVLSVLKTFASLPDEASLSDITTSVGLSKVKVCRALKTLVLAGFAEQNEETRKYRLHYALLDLSSKLLSSRNMNVAGRKILEELSDAVKEDITVAVPDKDAGQIVFVDRIRGASRISFFCDVGKRLPLHVGAAAKAILAYLPEAEFEDYLAHFQPVKISPFTIVSPEELRKQRRSIRKSGFSISNQEVDEGVSAVGACILDIQGMPSAGIAVTSLTVKMDQQKIDALGRKLTKAVRDISFRLGCSKETYETYTRP